ncbi:hypothetical protein [Kluyvera genomosp. 3]|uniref:Uncharacterized protein n=1 Tax=Kluyvera genomosp. 3 TaxID=2774055 RepID=A0A6G9REP4_9ENTR|nr:hypothetical protein [Kluyvera genomosp. 3]QIR25262.1 hypothetical protein GY169_07685 [Kluyvera genomosp. 3]
MANFLKSVMRMGEHSITQPFKAVKQTFQGHPDDAFKDLFHDASRTGQDVAHSIGVRGWVGSHPMQSVGAAVAMIYGGWAAAGAMGAGSAAGGATAAAGSAGSAGAAGAAGSSLIPAGTAIGQTVPAIPSVASMTSGTGAAITATPSYSILAGASPGGLSLSSGGAAATHLGGEAAVSNTGLSSTSTAGSWAQKAKDYYNTYQQISGITKQGQGQQEQQGSGKPQEFLRNDSLIGLDQIRAARQQEQTQPISGINLNTDQSGVPDFTHGGTFGGFQ